MSNLKASAHRSSRFLGATRAHSSSTSSTFASLTAWRLVRAGRSVEVHCWPPEVGKGASYKWRCTIALRGEVGEGGALEKGVMVSGSRKDFMSALAVAAGKAKTQLDEAKSRTHA